MVSNRRKKITKTIDNIYIFLKFSPYLIIGFRDSTSSVFTTLLCDDNRTRDFRVGAHTYCSFNNGCCYGQNLFFFIPPARRCWWNLPAKRLEQACLSKGPGRWTSWRRFICWAVTRRELPCCRRRSTSRTLTCGRITARYRKHLIKKSRLRFCFCIFQNFLIRNWAPIVASDYLIPYTYKY